MSSAVAEGELQEAVGNCNEKVVEVFSAGGAEEMEAPGLPGKWSMKKRNVCTDFEAGMRAGANASKQVGQSGRPLDLSEDSDNHNNFSDQSDTCLSQPSDISCCYY